MCETLNKNNVLVARHFQYSVELFFRIIILNRPVGKTKYYAMCIEFKVRDSPHIHSFIWILNEPKIAKTTKENMLPKSTIPFVLSSKSQ